MLYQIGDRVLIKSKWPLGADEFLPGHMGHWRGRIMTIREIDRRYAIHFYRMVEDFNENGIENGWYWNEALFEGLVPKAGIIVSTSSGLIRMYPNDCHCREGTDKDKTYLVHLEWRVD